MNYAALSYEELAGMATTDEAARQYIADNAVDILEDVNDLDDEYLQGAIQDAYSDGEDSGSNEERDDFRGLYAEKILELCARLSKSKLEMTPLRKECRDLLASIIKEYGL